jgi:hypothetical protein
MGISKIVLACALAVTSSASFAFDTYRAGSHVLHLNDSESDLLNYMGQPDTKQPVDNRLGAHLGDNYFYNDHSKTVKFFVSGGLIVEITETRH